MNAVTASFIHDLRPKILDRRARLQSASHALPAEYVNELLNEIDAALARIDEGSFGLCESCHDTIEADRLECDPLVRFCLDHLNERQRRAHEEDLELATQIQSTLLPAKHVASGDWSTYYRYQPAGLVGGDYCEIAGPGEGRTLFFAVGDVTGKGVAASLLMTHLSAIFRSLLALDLPIAEMMSRANRLFCLSTPATHYATLVAGRATEDGVELCNAGHCRPLLLRADGAERVDATGLPLGLFCEGRYTTRRLQLGRGETLVLYSDGISETEDAEGNAFEEDALLASLRRHASDDVAAMGDGVVRDVVEFRAGGAQQDDMTLLLVRRR